MSILHAMIAFCALVNLLVRNIIWYILILRENTKRGQEWMIVVYCWRQLWWHKQNDESLIWERTSFNQVTPCQLAGAVRLLIVTDSQSIVFYLSDVSCASYLDITLQLGYGINWRLSTWRLFRIHNSHSLQVQMGTRNQHSFSMSDLDPSQRSRHWRDSTETLVEVHPKSFGVKVDELTWGVLPAALERYRLGRHNWRTYVLFLCYDSNGRGMPSPWAFDRGIHG